MLKHKIVVAILIFSLVFGVFGVAPVSYAASLSNARDLLSDSDLSVVATHTITFVTGTSTKSGEWMEVTLPAPFGNITTPDVACSDGMTPVASTTEIARCTNGGGTIAAGTSTITLSNISNPASEGSQQIRIATYTSAGVLKEEVYVWVAIINNIDVSATVSSTLTFEISPLPTGDSVNGTTTDPTVTAATSSLAFGTLTVDLPRILGQQLRVVTNADDGYTVTVEQNQNLTSGSGSDIDSFKDGTASTTAVAWTAPLETLDVEYTYGHMGITSEDATLSDADHFGNNLWQGFASSTPIEVMYHTGPADGIAAGIGITKVAYQIQVSPLQESGDYYNTLTYICTPTY